MLDRRLWVYSLLSILLDVDICAISACMRGLSVHSAAFYAEAYRASIEAMPRGDSEAAQAFRLTGVQTVTRIVLPLAIRLALPPR